MKIVFTLWILFAAMVWAQGDPLRVVVTPTRQASSLEETPAWAFRVDEAEQDTARSLQDAIRNAAGVMLQRTSSGQVSPFLRGFTGYHTLTMMDGIRLNTPIMRSGPNEYWGLIDGLSSDRVEAVLGPGSVLYGSDAVGGVVQAIPRRRRDWDIGTDFSRRLYLRASSAEESLTGRAEISGMLDGSLGFVLGGSLQRFGELDGGGDIGRQDDTDFDGNFADLALDLRASEHWSFGLLAQKANLDDVNRVHRTRFGVSFHGTSVGSEFQRRLDWNRDLVALDVRGTDLESALMDDMRLILSYQSLEEQQDRIRGDGRRDKQGFDVETLGVALQISKGLGFGRLTYGADWYHDEVDSFRRNFDAMGTLTSVNIQGPVGDDACYDLMGLYAQLEVPLGDRFDLVVGGRLTYAATEIGSLEDPATGAAAAFEDDWWSLVGSVRVLFHATEDLRFYGGVSQAFRAPNLSDLSRLDTALSSELEIPSTDLSPEDFITFEIGSHYSTGSLSASMAFAYTVIDDLIIRQPTGMVSMSGDTLVRKRNGAEGGVLSLDAQASWWFAESWCLFGTFSWVDAEAELYRTSAPVSSSDNLSKMSPIRGTLGVAWVSDSEEWEARLWGAAADRQDRLNSLDRRDTSRIPPGGTPGWGTLNASVSFRPEEDMHFFLAVENILDKNYRLHGSGVQEPGINVILGADITF